MPVPFDQSTVKALTSVAAPRYWEILREACVAVGLSGQDARVIRAASNVLFRLPERGGIVVRISPASNAMQVGREIAAARWLAEQDVPAARLVPDLPQGRDFYGYAVSFYWEIAGARPGLKREMAPLLKRLHALPVPSFLRVTSFDPTGYIFRKLKVLTNVTDEQREWLRSEALMLRARISKAFPESQHVVCHGNAWEGNVLVNSSGVFLIDFEEFTVGPREWDLVPTLAGRDAFGHVSRVEWDEFSAAYGTDISLGPGVEDMVRVYNIAAVCIALEVAMEHPQFLDQAKFRLACVRGEAGPGPWNWVTLS